MKGHTCPGTKYWPATGYSCHWTARGLQHAESILIQCRCHWTAGIESGTFLSWVKRATRWVLFLCVCMEIVFALSNAGNKYFCPDKFCQSIPPRDLMVVPSIVPLTSSLWLLPEWNVAKWGIPFPCIWGFFYPTKYGFMKIVTGEWKLFVRRFGKKVAIENGRKIPLFLHP